MAAELPPDGTTVRARPLGWDEELTAEDEFDLDPFDGDRDEILTGPLTVVRADAPPSVGPVTVVLVGGREADPATVEAV